MEIYIDLTEIMNAANNPVTFIWWMFIHGGWIFLIFAFIYGALIFWLEYRRGLYDQKRKFVILAVDIPKNNEQSPKAVEQIFDHLFGAQTSPKLEDKWIAGKLPESFSLEIISIGGYIQFLIQSPEVYRDLVEAAIYAQYPDAEIFEVGDYTEKFKGMKFPNEEYNLWGTELVLSSSYVYPIKTYVNFEHGLSQELKDPLASLMENFSKLGPNEQLWLQYVVTPADNDWKGECVDEAKKLIGAKVKVKKSMLDKAIDAPFKILSGATDIISTGTVAEKKEEKKDAPSQMQYLSPGEKFSVEEVEKKAGHNGFWVKARLIYLAKKSAFDPGRRVDAIMGSLSQFNGSNSFKNHKKKKTKVYGLFKKWRLDYRRTNILRQYRMRARQYEPGYYGYILNSEELATIFHFPIYLVKAPLMKKTETKKAEPPMTLPIGELPIYEKEIPVPTKNQKNTRRYRTK